MLEDVLREYGAEEVSAFHVYQDIFWLGDGMIQRSDEPAQSKELKANPIGYFKNKNEKHGHFRVFFEDTFEETLKEMQEADFAVMNGLTYFGRKYVQEHASKMYAMIFDLDGVTDVTLDTFLHGAYAVDYDIYPIPNYIVLSGGGVHLYYLFENPIPLFPNIKIQLKAFKYALTRQLWNGYTSENKEVQVQGINQPFRVIGGKSKIDYGCIPTRAFHLSNHPFTLSELGKYVPDKELLVDENKLFKETTMTLEEAKKAYPQWYQDKVINKQPRRYWEVKPDLYEWWKRQILNNRDDRYGHRYFSIMCLAIYGAKCNIPYEQVKADALNLIPFMNDIAPNHPDFSKADVMSALECYDKKFCTFPRNDMEKISGIRIEKNKRNYRTQENHLKVMRAIQEVVKPNWRDGNGRKPKAEIIKAWRAEHPEETKADCNRQTGIDPKTIRKWWDSYN